MKVVVRPRQGGKTTELLGLAHQESAYIVCLTQARAHQLGRLALELGFDIPFPISWDEFKDGRFRGGGIKGFIIDDLDQCLASMTTVPIKAVSLTGPSNGW